MISSIVHVSYSFQQGPSAHIAWKRKRSRNDSLFYMDRKGRWANQEALLHIYKSVGKFEISGWGPGGGLERGVELPKALSTHTV